MLRSVALSRNSRNWEPWTECCSTAAPRRAWPLVPKHAAFALEYSSGTGALSQRTSASGPARSQQSENRAANLRRGLRSSVGVEIRGFVLGIVRRLVRLTQPLHDRAARIG